MTSSAWGKHGSNNLSLIQNYSSQNKKYKKKTRTKNIGDTKHGAVLIEVNKDIPSASPIYLTVQKSRYVCGNHHYLLSLPWTRDKHLFVAYREMKQIRQKTK